MQWLCTPKWILFVTIETAVYVVLKRAFNRKSTKAEVSVSAECTTKMSDKKKMYEKKIKKNKSKTTVNGQWETICATTNGHCL